MSKENDYLFEMFQKYAPSQDIEGIPCFTKESAEWFDCIIYAKVKSEALSIIIKKRVNVGNLFDFVLDSDKSDINDSYNNYVETFEYADGYYDLGTEMLTREEYIKIKEAIKYDAKL